ncbi:MAG: zinc-ribbon domain-containing protein [Blastochloris sp.]|nr:zinc-ribbon domain-containing protein [Blastochloris sp.]
MLCPHCDHALPDQARFCTNCGTAVNATPALQPTMISTPTIPLGTIPAPITVPPASTATPSIPVQLPPQLQGIPVNVHVTITNTVAPTPPPIVVAPPPAPAPSPVVILPPQEATPNLLLRATWFLFIGWWVGFGWTWAAWFLMVTIIGLPFGIAMLNRLPQVMTLKPIRKNWQVTQHGGVTVVGQAQPEQHSFAVRALYFLLIGWWSSFIWLACAWSILAVTFGLAFPVSFWMFDRTPAVTTLAKQ